MKWPAVAVGVVAAAAVVVWWWWTNSPAPDAGGDDVPNDSTKSVQELLANGTLVAGPRPVVHRERAAGVDQRLQDFLDEWERTGPFQICVCPDGGVRTDEAKQEALAAAGKSNAATLADTPHGRAGAVDLAPYYRWSPQYDDWSPFEEIGARAKAFGLRWGGDFINLRDGPHVEVPDWRGLPFDTSEVA